ncbi:hypothetical protein Tco_0078965 [Tanacetum coccineum]
MIGIPQSLREVEGLYKRETKSVHVSLAETQLMTDSIMSSGRHDIMMLLRRWYGTNALSKFSPDTELVLYPIQDKLTSGDKSLDLSALNYPAYSSVSYLQGLLVVRDRMGLISLCIAPLKSHLKTALKVIRESEAVVKVKGKGPMD